MEIFESFCLPTVQHQTNSNFLWIIRTDPMLDESLKSRLLHLLENASPWINVMLIGSNENPEIFRELIFDRMFNEDLVWYGSIEIAKKLHTMAQSHFVLETRLDADDGLHGNFMESLQQDVFQNENAYSRGW
eukprot:CAMPEP_0194445644 /NCGR_PEP_ID=MMETSP0176-20130528/127984_1 /TAXON_ID=216777 /ORGANISM="Proboscia alata, Strain PI-D3" /LENGTH=131 /DNA_ID=CAMNT_0039272239 /DNA_START=377 /DNA_END=769 /DNA_ORIENTATION=-